MKYSRNRKNLEDLQETIENFLGVYDIDSKRRSEEIVKARTMYFVIARKRNYSLDFIGNIVNRNHATVIHGLKLHDNYMRYDKCYKIVYENLLIHINKEENNTSEIKEIISLCSQLSKAELQYILKNTIKPLLLFK